MAARRPLFGGAFTTPVMVLHADALEHNLALMARYCRDTGVELAPHGKTTLAPQLFARQLAHGAHGITAATGARLRLYRAFGVPRVLLANQLVDRATVVWLRAELDATPDFEVTCYVDSPAAVALLADAFNRAPTGRPLSVLIEVSHPGGRTGCRSLAQVEEVAEAGAGQRLEVGDWVGCGLAHPCTAFDKWRLIPVVADDVVVDCVRTFF